MAKSLINPGNKTDPSNPSMGNAARPNNIGSSMEHNSSRVVGTDLRVKGNGKVEKSLPWSIPNRFDTQDGKTKANKRMKIEGK